MVIMVMIIKEMEFFYMILYDIYLKCVEGCCSYQYIYYDPSNLSFQWNTYCSQENTSPTFLQTKKEGYIIERDIYK